MENNPRCTNTNKDLHIAMLPWFAYGHINPFIDLSNKLTSHGFHITFFSIPGNIPRIQSSLILSPNTQIIPLSLPYIPGLSPDFDSSTDITPHSSHRLMLALDQMKPMIHTHLSNIRPEFVFFDFAHCWLPQMASELGIKAVYFSVFSAASNSYLTVPSRMSNPINLTTIEELKKPPLGFPKTSITSCPTFEAENILCLFTRFNDKPSGYEKLMSICKNSDAFVYKSCHEMEGPYIDYIKSQFGKPILLIGPPVPASLSPLSVLDEKWATWLDQFKERSVIFCNFGSETYLNSAQIEELTLGLELTGLPFFLVLNFGTSFDAENKLEEALPKGFKDRVKNKGVVETGWVPQQQILAHKNVGCYVCHSGFSSVIEGIVNDCQLVLVPQKGDQFFNSKLLSGDLRVAIEVNRRDEDGFFGREDIARAVKIVMDEDNYHEEGEIIRVNHKKWKEYLLDRGIQEKYLAHFVEELKDLVGK